MQNSFPRDCEKRSIFAFVKDQKASFYFLQETYSDSKDESFWKSEWDGNIIFSHGSHHSRGVCTLIDPAEQVQIAYSLRDDSGRVVLINLTFQGLELSLCNIHAPNNHSDQLQFIAKLNNYLIDKSEIASLIIGGDWNGTFTKKDKKGGLPWNPTGFRNSILITMEMFDLFDIQKVKHPTVNIYSYESKALKMKSRNDFFLVAKQLSKYVHKADIESSIALDQKLVCVSLKWENELSRGPGFWKFNNSLLKDENCIQQVRILYPVYQKKYRYYR